MNDIDIKELDNFNKLSIEEGCFILGVLKDSLYSIGIEESCRFDHNGNCQEHYDFSYNNTCYMKKVIKIINKITVNK